MNIKNIIGGMVGLFLLSCSQQETEDMLPSQPGGGDGKSYVINYALDTDELPVRAIDDQLPVSQRISSLHYLLYDDQGQLVKNTTIPDISEATVWPLTRENMTWQQRQALKDTLIANRKYTAIMLANVDPDNAQLFRNKKHLAQAELLLPTVAYQNHTIPYIWKGEILYSPVPEENNRKHPLKLKLRRMLSRLDITVETIEAKDVPYATEFESQLKTAIANDLSKRLNSIKKDNVDWWRPDIKQEAYVDNLISVMTGAAYINLIYPSLKKDLIVKQISQDPEFKHRNSWTDFTAFALAINGTHNSFPLNDLCSRPAADIVSSPVYDQLLPGQPAIWLGFSGNTTTEKTNEITKILLKSPNEELNILLSEKYPICLKKNECRQLICHPATSVKVQDPPTKPDVKAITFKVNMLNIYGNIGSFLDANLEPVLKDFPANKTRTKMINAIHSVLGYDLNQPDNPNNPGYEFSLPLQLAYGASLEEAVVKTAL